MSRSSASALEVWDMELNLQVGSGGGFGSSRQTGLQLFVILRGVLSHLVKGMRLLMG